MKQLPTAFVERMKIRLSSEEFPSFLEAYDLESIQTIRLNPKKESSFFNENQSVPWYENGRILKEKMRYITDPLWHAGVYYVQESSSMILAEVFKQLHPSHSPERALDLCAAPGGKSTLLQSLLNEEAILVANEVIKPRAQILKENHIRLGLSANLLITQNDPKNFRLLDEVFDYIQVDAPCSGEGMFRKDEIALREWSEANCQLCSERQKRILADILPALAKDGYLVYSTCTFNPKENEELIHWACSNFDLESVALNFPADWGICEIDYQGVLGYYFYPHQVQGEGLFLSVMQKKTGLGLQSIPNAKKPKSIEIDWLEKDLTVVQDKETLVLESNQLTDFKHYLNHQLNVIYSGVEMGELKGKNFIPAQALANFHKKMHHFPSVEVDLESALQFLRGNDPNLDLKEKGIYLLTYQGNGLGFVKFLGNRSNNYYPKPWRIKNY